MHVQVRFILNKSERAKIVKECHKDPTSGHLGTKRTLSRVTERFMWPGVAKDVYHAVSRTFHEIKAASDLVLVLVVGCQL